jgi:hypothetical protein
MENIKVKPSQFVQAVLTLNGQPFSLEGRDWLIPIYDGDLPYVLMYTGRQVEKSTTLAGHMLSRVLLIPYFQALYVAPSSEQAKVFAHQKLEPFIKNSKLISTQFVSTKLVNRVFEKEFTNGSRIMLGYAFLNADRIRGKSADALYLDEIQDMLADNIPVIEETMSHSHYGYKLYAGTPKHKQSTIEYYWNKSTQTEWAVKCEHCGKWNIPDESNLSPDGLICGRCHSPLNVRNGVWVDKNPNAEFYGVHISQLIVPWIRWRDIWWKYNNYPRAKFYNEVLGLSYDEASYSLTLDDLIRASEDYDMLQAYDPVFLNYGHTYMGIDWAATSAETGSYTAVVIGAFINGKFKVVYMKRYRGVESEISRVLDDLTRLAIEFRVKRIGADWGVGSGGANAILRGRVAQYHGDELDPLDWLWEFYYSSNLRPLVKWDSQGRKFILNRTESITNIVLKIKERKIAMPKFSSWQDYSEDFLNIFLEYNSRTGKSTYNKPVGKSDDFVHALNFAYTTALIDIGELNPTIARVSTDIEI